MPEVTAPRVALVIVAQAHYDDDGWGNLPQVPASVNDLAGALTAGGYDLELPALLEGGTKDEVERALDDCFGALSPTDRVLLYWTGHGALNGDHYLVTRDSPKQGGLTKWNAIATGSLGDVIAKSRAEKVLVVLDTCYSSGGGADIATDLLKILTTGTALPGQQRFVAFLPSAHALAKAQEVVLCRALVALLTGTDQYGRPWTDQDRFVPVADLSDALTSALQSEMGPGWLPPVPITVGSGQRFLPNPLYAGPRPAVDVETKRKLLQIPEALQAAAAATELTEAGTFFTGRVRVLTELADWLGEGDGLVVVTGPPGSGKSAVLGRVATLSDPAAREAAEEAGGVPEGTVPPERSVDVAVHAKGLSVLACAQAIAAGAEMVAPSGPEVDPSGFVDEVRGLGRRLTVAVDALDEAADPPATGDLLRRLATEAGARVLVGCRRTPEGSTPEGEDRHTRLRVLFGPEAKIIDLEDEAETEADIATYVGERLLRDPRSIHRHASPGTVEAVATQVAQAAEGSFLYARVISRTMQEAPDPASVPLPAGPLEAFVQDLGTRFEGHEVLVEELLAALAWAEGAGLSRGVWPAVAAALSPTGATYTARDVAWVLDHAGFHIYEAGEEGQGVYRLAHQSFADHFRDEIPNHAATQGAIADALAGETAGLGWLDADPYLWRHLAAHAANGGVLDLLVTDPGYLAVADPAGLLPALGTLTAPAARRMADLYRRVADRLYGAETTDRMALLHLTAHQEDPEFVPALEPLLTPRWRCRWAQWRPSSAHQVIGRHEGGLTSVAFGKIDGTPVVISGGEDGTVRLWDARSGVPRDSPLTGHEGGLTSVAFGKIDGTPLVISGGKDRTVRLWDARSGVPRDEPLTSYGGWVSSVAFGKIDGTPVVVTGRYDGTVRLWDARSGVQRGTPLTGHGLRVSSVAFGKIDGTPVVISGGEDGTVRLWDARSGVQRGTPLTGHGGRVSSVAFGEIDGTPVVISGGEDGTVRLWDARSGVQRGTPLTGHGLRVSSVAFGKIDGTPMVISGGEDGTVRLWDARSGVQRGTPLTGHGGRVSSVAFGEIDGTPMVISGGEDGTVRLWDAPSGVPRDEPLTGYGGRVSSVAFGEIDGTPVVISGGEDGTVRLWDAPSGVPRDEPLTGYGGRASSVAFGKIDGTPVVVTGRYDGTVCLWDARSGVQRGTPLTGHGLRVSSVAFGKIDGTPMVISSCRYDRTVRLWDARSGVQRGTPLTGHDGWVSSVAFGEIDGTPVVISGGEDGTVRLWDARSGVQRGTPLTGHGGRVTSVAFGKIDGTPVVISGGEDGTVRLCDARSGVQRGTPLTGHGGRVTSVAFGKIDGTPMVISGGDSGTIRVWSPDRNSPIATVEFGSSAAQIAFSPPSGLAVAMSGGLVVMDLPSVSADLN